MSRGRRLETVVRIRELQSRMAEVEAARARNEVDRRRLEVDRAVTDLEARREASRDGVDTIDELRRQRDVLASAADEIGLRREQHALADHEFDGARSNWLEAHQRHEAIDRLHERTVAEEFAERGRLEQLDIDEHATVRHGRRDDGLSEEEQ